MYRHLHRASLDALGGGRRQSPADRELFRSVVLSQRIPAGSSPFCQEGASQTEPLTMPREIRRSGVSGVSQTHHLQHLLNPANGYASAQGEDSQVISGGASPISGRW